MSLNPECRSIPFEAIERASKRRSPAMTASAKISLEIPDWWKNLLLPIGIWPIVGGLVHFDDLAVSGQKNPVRNITQALHAAFLLRSPRLV